MTKQELPEGWKVVFLGDSHYFKRYGGGTPKRSISKYWANGSIPWLTNIEVPEDRVELIADTKEKISEAGLAGSSATIVPKGSVLLTCTASIGKVAIARIDLTTNQQFNSFQCNLNKVVPQFLAYFLLTQKEKLESIAGQTTFKHITIPNLVKLEIPLPPLEEQRQIVAILEQAEELGRLRAEADRLTEQILPSAFIEMFGDPRENPKGREEKALGTLCDVQIGGTPRRNQPEYWGGDNPWVTVAELNGGIITETNEKITDLGVEKSNVKLIPKGTVLLSFKLSIGKVAIAGIDLYTNEAVAALPIKEHSLITTEYLRYVLPRLDLQQYASGAVKGETLNKRILEGIKIPRPPLELQHQFAELVNELQVNQQRQAEARKLLDSLYQSLSARAFTGELTAEWREEQKARVTERQAVILVMLSRLAQQSRRQVLITALMKYLFLLQMEGRARGLYRFVPYKYGPFAREVYEDLEALKERGLVTVTVADDEGERTEIALQSERDDEIVQMVQSLPKDVREDAEGVIELYGELSLKQLLDHVYAEYPDYAVRSKR